MTLYNILFGIVFLGACRQLLLLMGTVVGWDAATITAIVFNDVVNTSQVLESKESRTYSIEMKFVDLLNFMILSLALVSLNPNDNPFGVQLAASFATILQPWITWLLLTLYWALLILWNWLCGVYGKWPLWVGVVSHVMIAPFGVMAIVTYVCSPEAIPTWCRALVFILSTFYLFRPFGR